MQTMDIRGEEMKIELTEFVLEKIHPSLSADAIKHLLEYYQIKGSEDGFENELECDLWEEFENMEQYHNTYGSEYSLQDVIETFTVILIDEEMEWFLLG